MKIALSILCATLAWAQPGEDRTFSVRVVNKVSGAPIPGVTVVIHGPNEQTRDGSSGQTNSLGLFSVPLKDAGTVLFGVSRRGFLASKLVYSAEIKPDERGPSQTIEMTPLAAVTGRVVDQYGDPLNGAIVRLLRKRTTAEYGDSYESSANAVTNDRGEYRVVEVRPALWYVAAEYSSRDHDRTSPDTYRSNWRMIGGFALYPRGTNIAHAQQVEVHAGETIHLPDLVLAMEPAVSVEGRVVSPAPGHTTVSVTRVGPRPFLNVHRNGTLVVDKDGRFVLQDVLPGKYRLNADNRAARKVSPGIEIDVGATDIKGIELELTAEIPVLEISGRVQIDGKESLDVSRISVSGFGVYGQPLDSQGRFRIEPIINRGQFGVNSLPGDWHLSKVLISGQEVAGGLIQLPPGRTEVTLVLNPNGGRVSGRVLARHGSILGPSVALIPESGEIPELDSLLSAKPDADSIKNQSFTIRGVPPGDYRVVAFDVNGWALVFNRELLKKHLKSAPLVRVTEGGRHNIDVPLLETEKDP